MAGAITKAKAAFATASASIPVTFSVSTASVAAVLKDTKAAFRSASATIPLQFSVTTAAVTAGAVLARAAFKASGQAVTMPITFSVTQGAVTAGAVAARAAVKASGQTATMPITFTVNTGSLAAATVAAKALAGATSTAATAAAGAGGAFGFLARQVPLFGGLLNKILPDALRSVAVWHILGDAIIEFGAVVIPATIAVGAWGIAASDAINNVSRQLTAYHTVSDAFQQSLPIFGKATGAMEALHKAVQPQVYQLFGDAITIMNSKTGEFSKLALGTGTVLDRLGARFAVAVTSGNTFSTFMKNAIPDVAKIGDSLGNLGGVFGNLMKAVPGYANVLLNLFDTFTKIAETATRVAEPVIAVGLALHGFILYTGLAVTASLALIGAMGRLIVSFFTFSASTVSAGVTAIVAFSTALWTGAAAVVGYVAEIATMILVNGAGAASAYVLADAMAVVDATGGPIVWIAGAVIALAGLVFWMNTSKDTTQKWYASLQTALLAAPAGVKGLTLAQTDLALGTAKVAGAQKAANDAIGKTGPVVGAAGRYMTNYSAAADHATQKLQEVQTGNAQLRAEIGRGNATMTVWAGKFGGVAAATGLATIAGITYGNQISKNSTQQAINIQQMTAAQQGLQAMGVQAGTLGNDMQILTQQTTDQYKAVQNLNTGLATFIGNVTGTQTSFDTVALGGITLAANLTAANHAAQTTTHTMGGLKVASTLAGAAMDGSSQASVTLNQAFATQVGNINTLAASWRTAGIASNLQTQGMKDAIAPMLQYAKGSKEATNQLIALAETAGAPSWVTSFSTLTKWIGNTTGAYANMKAITDQATQQEALLSGAMQGQGNYIANTLLKDLSNAELKYSGVVQATQAWGKAIAQDGIQSSQAQGARTALINDIIASGKHAGDTTAQIAAMIAKITSIPASKALAIVMDGTGKYSISSSATNPYPGGISGRAAAGMLVTGGTPGKDSVLVSTMPGELIVPTPLVNAGAVDHLRGRIPGFDAGGLVGGVNATGNTNVLTGQQAVTDYSSFTTSVKNALVSAMRTAILAVAKAAAAAAISGVAGPGGGSDAANAALARQMMPAWASGSEWAAWNQVAMMESGWSTSAANPTSSARGIAQNISGYGPGYLAGNAASQISWMIQYIQGRYGDPIGALAHENAYHWYGTGTQGAAPGWGVVGERGPELVKFHGGETVVPNSLSMAALGGLPGYAAGAGSSVATLKAALAGKVSSENRVTGLIAKHLAAEKTGHTPKGRATAAREVATERRELALWRTQAAVLTRQIAALGPAKTAGGAPVASWQAGRTDFQRWPKETYPADVAATATLLAQQKAVIAAGGLPAADLRKIRAALVSTQARSAFLKTEGKDVTAYQVHLRAYTKLLADQVAATRSVGLKSESASLAKTLAGAAVTLTKVSAWLAGPAAVAATAAATTTAPAGPSGQDLITAWLTAQGWVVGGTITPPAAKAMQWFDTGGRLPTGVSMVGNQTGGSERILSHGEEDALSRLAGGGGSKVEALLGQVVRLLGDAPGKTAAGVGDAINGAARGAVRRGPYATR
jgi:hypothetical protein